MWGRKRQQQQEIAPPEAGSSSAPSLRDAMRQARVDTAERTATIVDLRDAEQARLEVLNDALDPVFAEVPSGVEIFDRGISRGETPRLWLDAVAHVVMGPDKRLYRFVQDTRFGRKVLAESPHVPEIAKAVTRYVAARLIERERMLSDSSAMAAIPAMRDADPPRTRPFTAFLLGSLVGFFALFVALWVAASRVSF